MFVFFFFRQNGVNIVPTYTYICGFFFRYFQEREEDNIIIVIIIIPKPFIGHRHDRGDRLNAATRVRVYNRHAQFQLNA